MRSLNMAFFHHPSTRAVLQHHRYLALPSQCLTASHEFLFPPLLGPLSERNPRNAHTNGKHLTLSSLARQLPILLLILLQFPTSHPLLRSSSPENLLARVVIAAIAVWP